MHNVLKIKKTAAVKLTLEEKLSHLKDFFAEKLTDGIIITYSGGVDSTFLLWAAKQVRENCGGKFIALSTTSASMPEYDKKDASAFTTKHKIDHVWIESKEIDNPQYQQNDSMRCYHCKTELFDIAGSFAKKNNYRWIVYGYNASDIGDDRPGHQAAIENNILFPLADFGFEKNEIRAILRENNIEIAEKPASPCLSSRIARGIQVTTGRLGDIAALESLIRKSGIRVFRVRINSSNDEDFLRIEIADNEMEKILSIKNDLINEGKSRGYKWITLDLAGYRTGGANE